MSASRKAGWGVEPIDPWRWRIPRQGGMRVEGLIYADAGLIEDVLGEKAVEQVAHVACLPGIVGRSLAMPDIHWGYGFPIGGVAAFDADTGVISPGGVGYDINCGVRLLATDLACDAIESRAGVLADALYRRVPAGVGSRRPDLDLGQREMDRVLTEGAGWAVGRGMGDPGEAERIEEGGCLTYADPAGVSPRARERGRRQLGTLGSGNHFLEVQRVDRIFDPGAAAAFGLFEGQVTVSIHSGSRGLGYQVCDEFLRVMLAASRRHGIELPDRQLCCAPLDSAEGRQYLGAMAAAANFAFANRQIMAHQVARVFEEDLGLPPATHGLRTVYDVCHNIAKLETHRVEGRLRRLCVHRKGATRAWGPGREGLPEAYRPWGQPVLIPGDMGRYSFVLAGREGSAEAFCSACHGAGRRLSRGAARKAARGRAIRREMEDRGIELRAAGARTVVEEIPEAYKDVARVVAAVEGAGLAAPVARLRPVAVIKG
ncbi:MAG: RtcB family protein [Acidobacteriota bacterium]|nr:RtcB family protein [Acidobacteriota bacterium]